MTEAIKGWIDARGKEYSEDFPKKESFRDGLNKGIEIAEGFAEWVEEIYAHEGNGKWYDVRKLVDNTDPVEYLATSQLLEKYLKTLEP